MPVGNGGIIGNDNIPTTVTASGVWSLSALYLAVSQGTWPGLGKTVIQTFTASTTWTCPTGVTEIEYLIVAGGGGGGTYAGGGGAGGFRTGTGLSVTAGTDYTITVGGGGAGGAPGVSNRGTSGSNSVFGTSPNDITSAGGGGGGGETPTVDGLDGGSGGGGR